MVPHRKFEITQKLVRTHQDLPNEGILERNLNVDLPGFGKGCPERYMAEDQSTESRESDANGYVVTAKGIFVIDIRQPQTRSLSC
jgi:hypothetical protein